MPMVLIVPALENLSFILLATDLTWFATLSAVLESEVKFDDRNPLANFAGIRGILPIKDLSQEVWDRLRLSILVSKNVLFVHMTA